MVASGFPVLDWCADTDEEKEAAAMIFASFSTLSINAVPQHLAKSRCRTATPTLLYSDDKLYSQNRAMGLEHRFRAVRSQSSGRTSLDEDKVSTP